MSGTDQGRLWGGRFAGGPADALAARREHVISVLRHAVVPDA